jgi:hypothetical protein
MKNKKTINVLVLIIAILAFIATLTGIMSSYGNGERIFISVFGEEVTLYGKGIYQNDSVSVTAQGLAQDYVTLILGIGVLLFSLFQFNKGSLKGKLLLLGMLGFFLYTYISYTFLWTYNPMFLAYVAIMSSSLFAFVLTIMTIDINNLKENFNDKMPVKFLGSFQIFIGIAIALLWIGKIVPALLDQTVPVGLDHYTTLVIQAMDLGFIVPTAILSGTLLIKKSNYGYLLSSVVIIKGIALLSSISAMIFSQFMAGVNMNIVEIIMFPIFNIIVLICLIILLKNIKEVKKSTLS